MLNPEMLSRYFALGDPLVLGAVCVIFCVLTLVFARNPGLFLQCVIITAPLPKLFSIGITQSTQVGLIHYTSVPGISLVEVVIAAGMVAAINRFGQLRRCDVGFKLGQGLAFCSYAVVISVVVGMALRSTVYSFTLSLYALRYLATFACFFLARRYLILSDKTYTLLRALRLQWTVGNVVIALSLIYYFVVGSSGSLGYNSSIQLATGESGITRHQLLFFDGPSEVGCYIALTLPGAGGAAAARDRPAGHGAGWAALSLAHEDDAGRGFAGHVRGAAGRGGGADAGVREGHFGSGRHGIGNPARRTGDGGGDHGDDAGAPAAQAACGRHHAVVRRRVRRPHGGVRAVAQCGAIGGGAGDAGRLRHGQRGGAAYAGTDFDARRDARAGERSQYDVHRNVERGGAVRIGGHGGMAGDSAGGGGRRGGNNSDCRIVEPDISRIA